jgi:CheY-like chemotaxis protein
MSEHPMNILLVDDDADCRHLMKDAIAETGVACRVFEATNGRAALDFVHGVGAFAHAPRPELIYLDLELPELSGQEVLRAVKSDPQTRDIAVVMMTGVHDEGQMALAARNGANSFTVKPADAAQFVPLLVASTNYWLRIHQYPRGK